MAARLSIGAANAPTLAAGQRFIGNITSARGSLACIDNQFAVLRGIEPERCTDPATLFATGR